MNIKLAQYDRGNEFNAKKYHFKVKTNLYYRSSDFNRSIIDLLKMSELKVPNKFLTTRRPHKMIKILNFQQRKNFLIFYGFRPKGGSLLDRPISGFFRQFVLFSSFCFRPF